jgi:hypothetical protein
MPWRCGGSEGLPAPICDLSFSMTTFALLSLVLLSTVGNLLMGFGTALYFGHGPKWLTAAIVNSSKSRLFAKRAQKSPQSPH